MGNCVNSNIKKQVLGRQSEVVGMPSVVVLPNCKQLDNSENLRQDNQSQIAKPDEPLKKMSASVSTAFTGELAGASMSQSEKSSVVSPFRPRGESNASDLTADMNPAPKKKKISYLLNVNGIEYKVPLLDPIESSSLLTKRFESTPTGLPVKTLENIQVARRPRGGSYNLDVVNHTSLGRKL